MQNKFTMCLLGFIWMMLIHQLDAQVELEPETQESDATYAEYDRFQGSSLGIRIETRDGLRFVSKVLAHLDDHPLEVGDQLVKVGDIDLSNSPLSKIGDLLNETDPGTEIPFSIIRDSGEEKTLNVATYRLEFVDIATIVDRIQANRIIRKHLEDTERIEDMDTMAERMVAAVERSRSPREAQEGINQVIDELGISHTAIVPKATYQQLVSSDGGELGLVIRRFQVNGRSGYFVIDAKPGSSAHQSSIKLGDEIVFINGVKIENSRRLILAGEEQKYEVFGIAAELGEPVQFDHRSHPDEPLKRSELETTSTVSLGDSVAASVKVSEHEDRQIGYIRFWNLMSTAASRELQRQLEGSLKDCDALVLDLRGRGGTLPTVLAVDRLVGSLELPVIAITDELTRSAKELLSFRLKKHKHVTVIGEKTSGAVTAATFGDLPSGNVLMYPVRSSESLNRYTDGESLEGNGVEPDEAIPFWEPYADGQDKLLESAIERAVEQALFD
jgi:carboxyl-terminal processing protease